jgi:hypothetical protein
MKKPNMKRKKEGIWGWSAGATDSEGRSYFSELPPIQVVAGIVLEYKNVIDSARKPDAAIQAEQKKQEVHEEVPCIYLRRVRHWLYVSWMSRT